jgi:hypothetical protein
MSDVTFILHDQASISSITLKKKSVSRYNLWGFNPFYRPQRPLGRVEVYLYPVFRLWHQKGVRGQLHPPAAFHPQERPGTHRTGGWVGPRAGLDRCGKLPPPGFDPRTVQPVASHYTDWATQPTTIYEAIHYEVFLNILLPSAITV